MAPHMCGKKNGYRVAARNNATFMAPTLLPRLVIVLNKPALERLLKEAAFGKRESVARSGFFFQLIGKNSRLLIEPAARPRAFYAGMKVTF
ncbi:MAG: hypothetical protein J0H40_15140 [Rhizobiales bacterium]|nr:hypothetical protein [Hyphomicrobiales bacterium]